MSRLEHRFLSFSSEGEANRDGEGQEKECESEGKRKRRERERERERGGRGQQGKKDGWEKEICTIHSSKLLVSFYQHPS